VGASVIPTKLMVGEERTVGKGKREGGGYGRRGGRWGRMLVRLQGEKRGRGDVRTKKANGGGKFVEKPEEGAWAGGKRNHNPADVTRF